jgi:hypothetical protein
MNKPFSEMTLAELAHQRGVLQGYIDIAVVQARRGGSTWAAIGSSLGVSTQEAHRRYHWVEKITSPADGA